MSDDFEYTEDMFDYWLETTDLREAIEYFPKITEKPEVAAAIADYKRSHACLEALMRKKLNEWEAAEYERTNPNRL